VMTRPLSRLDREIVRNIGPITHLLQPEGSVRVTAK
jgi:hypothetical protein